MATDRVTRRQLQALKWILDRGGRVETALFNREFKLFWRLKGRGLLEWAGPYHIQLTDEGRAVLQGKQIVTPPKAEITDTQKRALVWLEGVGGSADYFTFRANFSNITLKRMFGKALIRKDYGGKVEITPKGREALNG